jgi:hypothetical protein
MLPVDLVDKLAQCAANDFVTPRDNSFHWLSRFTTMVVVGLALELPELGYELRTIARECIPYFKYRIITRRGFEHAAKVIAFVGWMLIVGGVAGERVEEVNVKDSDARIQECSDAKVQAATLEAGDAAKSAKTAHDEADAVKGIANAAKKDAKDALAKAQAAQRELAHAESDAAKAQAIASNALRKSTEAESRTERAEHQADEVSKKVETAKSDVAVLQSLMSARRIIDTKPFEQLKQLKGKSILTYSTYDDEPRTLCGAISSALRSTAQMNAMGGCGAMEIVGPGIIVTGPDLSESRVVAKALSEAIGVNVTPVPDSPTGPNRQTGNPSLLKVIVGPKGLFWFEK